MSLSRQELEAELKVLLQQNHLAEILTGQVLTTMSDSSVRGLLMQVRAHRDIELCLARDALGHRIDDGIEDFTDEDMATAIRAWGGI